MKLAKLNNLHIIFFYLFLFSIPFQTRKVFLTENSFYSGAFTEWTTFFIYASDVFLILALFFWLISVLKNSSFKELLKNAVFVIPSLIFISINSGENPDLKQKINYKNRILLVFQTFFRKMDKSDFTKEKMKKNAKDEDDIRKFYFRLVKISKFLHDKFKKTTKLPKVWLFLFIFLAWIVLNLVINNDYPRISVFQTVKLIELSFLVVFVYFNLKNSKILLASLSVMVFSGFLQSLVAIYQFITQHSIFTSPILAKITGESIIGPQVPGVAKMAVNGEKIIRVYGTFPHPNILGGFLIFTTLITIYLYLEHKKDILSSKLDLKVYPEGEQTLIRLCLARISKFLRLFKHNNTNRIKSQCMLYSLLWITLIFTQTTALFFTFSRTAWAGFLLSSLIITIFYFYNHKIVSRETIEESCFFPDKVENQSSSLDKGSYKNSPLERGRGVYYEESQNYSLKSKIKSIFSTFFHIFNSILVKVTNKIVSRETISKINNNIKNTIINFKELFIVFLLLMFLIISNFSVIQARIGGDLLSNGRLPDNSAISDRNFYNNVSRETISENFIFGSGLGTYIFQIDDFVLRSLNNCLREGDQTLIRLRECAMRLNLIENSEIMQMLQPWQYQPAHNIYLLIASEIGVIGLLFFLFFVVYAIAGSIKIVSRETIEYNSSFPDKAENQSFSPDKGSYKNSPLERGKGVYYNESRNYSLKSKIRSIFSFLLSTFVLRRFKPPLTPPCQGENLKNKIVSRETFLNMKLNYFLLAIFISFLFIGLFDHYFWTLQQGKLMFWLVLGLMLASNNIISKENKY